MNYKNEKFDYMGFYSIPAFCYVYRNKNLVIATHAPESHSTSITNMGIEIPKLLSKKYGLDMDNIIYIEHYENSGNEEEVFWLINTKDKNHVPSRTQLTKKQVDALDEIIKKEEIAVSISFEI